MLFTIDWLCFLNNKYEKDEINAPIALSAFRDGDQGPSKVTKTEFLNKYDKCFSWLYIYMTSNISHY